jgi:hypothetical protein
MRDTTMTMPASLDVSSERPSANLGPAGAAAVAIGLAAFYLTATVSGRQATLFLIGVAAGLVLYHAAFGFTSSWRALVTRGQGDGLRAQMLMLALTCVVFFPVLARGQIFGQAVRGSVSPIGVSVVAGAFLFGVGMQLGGGCASGTLYTAGGGNTRMLLTLLAFIAGSVLGTAHMPWWSAKPAFEPLSLVTAYGMTAGLATSLALFAAITYVSLVVERRRHARVGDVSAPQPRPHLFSGPWPLVAGAIGLALVNIATLLVAGRPWGVTSAFALWGAKAIAATGVDVSAWPY